MSNDSIPLKRCSKCKHEFPATPTYFHKDKKGFMGCASRCKPCARNVATDWYLTNPEKATNTRATYRKAHREQRREYIQLHAAEYKQYNRESYHRHSTRRKQQVRRWILANPDKRKQIVTLANHRRRTRLRNAQGSHTATDIDCLYINQRGLCVYCGCKLNNKYHVDHVIPLSRGGSNNPDNLVLACAHCNTSKRDKLISEWR